MSHLERGPAWLHGHAHEPNPDVPGGDGRFTLINDGRSCLITPEDLGEMPQLALEECHIVSTGHGVSGPFRFSGVSLSEFLRRYAPGAPAAVDVISADGFGTRLLSAEIDAPGDRPPLLALEVDGAPLRREQGLIRLIVPSETDDALRQVKWVAQVVVHR